MYGVIRSIGHDVVFVETSTSQKRSKPNSSKVYMWKQAGLEDMRKDCGDYQTLFIKTYNSGTPVQLLWETIKSKLSASRHPCAIQNVYQSRTARKVKRLTEEKKLSSKTDMRRYQRLRKSAKTACRYAYLNYITNKSNTTDPKRFWSFINSTKCDSAGVSPLKEHDGLTYSKCTANANMLIEKFTAVFNKDGDTSNIHIWSPSP